jgi:regulator of nonsense transcripts 1
MLSTVRSNQTTQFIGNSHRINVALTRARHGLIIVGHQKTLECDKRWGELIKMLKQDKLIYNSKMDFFKKFPVI